MRCLPEVLRRWRDSDARLTRSDRRYRRDAHLAMKTDFVSRRLGAGRPLALWGAGEFGLKLSRLPRAKGARAQIRAWLEARGWVEGRHFTCLA